jgi:hypothetical protein
LAYECKHSGIKLLIDRSGKLEDKVIYTGQPLAYLRKHNVDGGAILRHAVSMHADFRRVDVAVDVFNTAMTPGAIYRQWKLQRMSNNFRKLKYIASDQGIETLYCGSMKSRKRKFRIYDKSIQQGMGSGWWTRFELEERSNAQSYAYHVANGRSIGALINRKLKPTADSKLWDEWARYITDRRAVLEHIEDEYTDPALARWEWLERVAAPALGRAIKVTIDKHPEVLDTQLVRFFDLVKREVD